MLYIELLQGCASRTVSPLKETPAGIYKMDVNLRGSDTMPGIVGYSANRIWLEDKRGVRYRKHRQGQDTKVDMKEFMFIKLKAKLLT